MSLAMYASEFNSDENNNPIQKKRENMRNKTLKRRENTKSKYNHSNAIISTNLLKSTSMIEGDIYLLQGHNYFSLNKNNEAIHSYKKALEIFKKNKDKLNTSKTHVSLSKLYFHTRFFNKSLSHLRTVINNIENIHDKILVITVYQLMGDIYSKLFLYEESRNSYLSAIDLVIKTHSLNHSFTSNIYYKYSKNEMKLNNIKEANLYTKKGLNICNIEQDSDCIIKFKLLQSAILLCSELYNQSLDKLDEVEVIIDKEHNLYPKMLLQKFKIYYLKNDIEKIDSIVNIIIKLNEKSLFEKVDYEETLYQYYSLKKDTNNAFIHLEKYHDTYKNEYKKDLLNRISELKTVLDFEVELQKNNSLKEINLQNKLVIKQQNKINEWQKIAIVAILITLIFSIFIVARSIKTKKEIRKMANVDSLTQLKNRRAISEIGKKLYNSKKKFSVILFDIDHFKNINDTYGHQAGDEVLKVISTVSTSSLRDSDHLGRYGGEEFIIFVENADIKKAKEIAERVRSDIENINYDDLEEGLKITASFGVSTYIENIGLKDIIAEADKNLYLSKDEGRNKVN